MSSSPTRIRDEVKAYVDAAYATQFPGGIDMPFGRLARDESGAPWRVAWVPGDGNEGPATKNAQTNPRTLGTVLQRFTLQVWADNFDNAWNLLMQVRRAVYLAAHGSFIFRGHTPLTEGELAAYNLEGHAWELRVDFGIPITDAPVPETTVTSVGHTTADDVSSETGCSS
jgi:hypothetical protein